MVVTRSLGLAKPCTNIIPLAVSPNQLNIYFATAHLITGPHSASSPPPQTLHELQTFLSPTLLTPLQSSPNTSSIEHFYFEHVTPAMLLKALQSLSSNACGPDDINRGLFKISMPVIFTIIIDLFNYSLSTSTFPTIWKQSHIVPISKFRRPSSPNDYRPISLLCTLSKILEHFVHTQLTSYFSLNELFDPLQTDFRRGHSTQTATIKLLDDVRMAIDKRCVTILVQIYLTKAFYYRN